MTVDSLLTWFLGFINGAILPLLFAIALTVFIYNVIKYFIIGAKNEEAAKKARSYAFYSILAFVLILCTWGIVRLVAGGIGLNRADIVCPDYVPYNICSWNIVAAPIPPVDEDPSNIPIYNDPINDDDPSSYVPPPDEEIDDNEPGYNDPINDGDPAPGTPIEGTLDDYVRSQNPELQARVDSCSGRGMVLAVEHGESTATAGCVTNEEAWSQVRVQDEDFEYQILPFGGEFIYSDIESNYQDVEISDIIGYIEYQIDDDILDCQLPSDCFQILRAQCESQGGVTASYPIQGGVGAICATTLPEL